MPKDEDDSSDELPPAWEKADTFRDTDIPRADVSRDPGSGSSPYNEDYTDSIAYETNDGRGETRTTFYERDLEDGEGDHIDWERLAKLNDGERAPERRDQNQWAYKKRFVQTISNQLGLTSYQTKRAQYIILDMDMDRFPTYTYEKMSLGIISLVVDLDASTNPEEWDIDTWIVRRDEFRELMESVDLERSKLWDLRKELKQKTDYFEDEP